MSIKQSLALFCLFSVASSIAQDEAVQLADKKETVVEKVVKPVKKAKKERYVVIDAQKIIIDTGIDKEPMQELKNLEQKYQKELKEMADGVLKLEQELKTKAATLSVEALKEKQAAFEEENQKMQLRLNRANNELRAADMQARTKVFQQLQQHAQETLVDKQGYKIVFERSGGIMAYAKSVDKSDDIVKAVKADIAKKAKAKEAKAAKAEAPIGEEKPAAASGVV